jgi:hypothetical protein
VCVGECCWCRVWCKGVVPARCCFDKEAHKLSRVKSTEVFVIELIVTAF